MHSNRLELSLRNYNGRIVFYRCILDRSNLRQPIRNGNTKIRWLDDGTNLSGHSTNGFSTSRCYNRCYSLLRYGCISSYWNLRTSKPLAHNRNSDHFYC